VVEEYHGLHGKLADRFGKGGDAAYTFVTCALAMAVSGFAAFFFNQGLLFPSLGPTVFLFFETPMAEMASPRNTLIGHLVAILAGALSLAVFGLLDHSSILQEGVTLTRVGAGALSVALTGAVLLLLRSSHPPTGATTLIVSLGLLQTPHEMVMLMVGVVLLTVVGWTINRALGVPMPIWSAEG
jgi:CBS domain-containing membrane protein